MKTVRFTGWKKGMQKIKFIQLLNSDAGLSLHESKSIKEDLLDGKLVEVRLAIDTADKVVIRALELGVMSEIID